jgi:hypothetical protein
MRLLKDPRRASVVVAVLTAGAVAGVILMTSSSGLAAKGLVRQIATGKLALRFIPVRGGGRKALPSPSAGVLEAAGLRGPAARAAARSRLRARAARGSGLGITPKTLGCGDRNTDGNVRVDQDCTFRGAAEEIIKFNPADPSNLIAGQNDHRIGYNHCGFDYSFDSGRHWGDMVPPFWNKENHPEEQTPKAGDPNSHTILGAKGTDRTYDFASDPVVAVDSRGRAYAGCVVISINSTEGDDPSDNANGLLVTSSPPNAGGSFYNNIGPEDRTRVVVEDNSATIFHDKPFITADSYTNSPNRDNVYATWTVFKTDPAQCGGPPEASPFGCSPIYGSMSTDHGLHWSTPEEISGTGPMCVGFTGTTFIPSPCNQDQGADPIVVPNRNGRLVVTFNNTNTSTLTNQQLAVVCQPSGSSPAGTAHLNCGGPTHVGFDQQAGEPLCDFGRGPEECIPGAYIRTDDFPRIGVNRENGHLFVTWQDYRTGEFDIHLAESTDGGATWTEAREPVNPDSGKDHYFPAIDVVPSRGHDHVGVSYFRTDRVPNENNTPPGGFAPGQNPGVQAENSDYALAGGFALDTPYDARVISPRFPPPDGNQTGFNGDYSGLTLVDDTAHPIWSDTRNASPYPPSSPDFQGSIHDEDIFSDSVHLPGGHGRH